jgi:hypothetical protein
MTEYVKQKIWKNFILILAAIFGAGMHIWWQGTPVPVFAQSLDQISVSLSLFDVKNEPVNGKYEVRFGIYSRDRAEVDAYPSNSDAGVRLWTETKEVEVRNGILRIFLGDTQPLPSGIFSGSSDYYLGVRIGDDSEMVPRKKITSVPSAFNSRFLNGKTVGSRQGDITTLGKGGKIDIKMLPTGTGTKQLVLGSDGRLHDQNTDTGTDAAEFNIGSGSGLGAENFLLSVSNAGAKPALRYNVSSGVWELSNDGSSFNQLLTGATGSFLPLSGGVMTGDIVFSGTQSFANLIDLGPDTVGNYVASLSTGNGLSGGAAGSEGAALSLSVALLSAVDGGGVNASFSGLEFGGAGSNELTLLQGCSDEQLLKWDDGASQWVCSNDLGGGTVGINLKEGVALYNNIDTIAFGSSDFDISSFGTEGSVVIDYVNSEIARKNQNETITGTWTFSSALGAASGGTGATTLTQNGVLLGNGTGAVSAVTGTSAQFLVANLTGVPAFVSMSGDATLSNAGALTIGSGAVTGAKIADGTIEEVDLEITNAPTGLNGYILSLDEATGGFTWIANTGGSGSSKWTDGGTFTYLTATGDDLVLGSATADSGFFFDVSASTVAFEGATANGFETTLGVVDPTADRALNLPNVSGTLATVDGAQTFTSATWNATAIGVAYGGTGLSATPTNGQLAIGNGTGYTLATLTDGTGITITEGAGTITVASTLGTTIEGSEIADGTIEEVDLEITNAPTGLNGYILSLDEATGGFTWIANTGGSGSSKWTDGGTFTYLTATGDDLVLGSATADSGFFFDVSASTVAFEGATANGFETTLGVVDPTADRALNLPNVSGTLATVDGAQTFTSATWNATAIGVAYGGTGLSATPTNGQLAIGNGTGYTLATLTDGTGITITEGAGTITVASTLGTTIEGSEIADGTIEEVDLEITNAPTGLNGYILSLDEATGGFTWIANTGGSGSSKWTDGGTFTYLTATGDDLVLGSATADSGFFFDVSASTVAFEGATANGFETTLGVVDPTADRALNLPNVSGTLATVDGAQTFTSATWNATAIGVAYGGTGLSATPTNGQLAIGNGTGYTLATLTDGTGITITEGAGTITVASTLGTTIEGSEIADGTIEEVDLEITNAPTGLNGYILSLDEATGGFTWIANTGGSGSSKWTDGGTFTYLTATGDDLVLGSATADSGFFFDVSASTVAFEGATANGFETTLGVVDPTADRALNLPNVSGTLATVDGAQTFTSATWNATAIGVAYGGTGLSATPTNGQLAIGNGTGYTLATLTDGTGITITEGAGTITVASTLGTTIEGSEIADGTIEEVDLEITNAPTGLNGYILSLDEATGGFTWIANTGGSGSSKWTDGGTFTYLTATGDDLVLGSATADSGFFFDVSASTVAFEGATANGFETTLGVVDPTADRALNLPNVSGTLATVDGAQTFTSATWNATAIGVAYGGTGLSATPTNGQLAIGNGTGYTLATLTDGTGITITEGAGTITVASTLGTDINLASAEVTGTLPVANGGTGATTLTQNGVLLGNGTGAVSAVTGTSAQFLVANLTGVPAFVSMSGDATLSNAGALTIGSGAVTGAKIADGTIEEVDLEITNAPTGLNGYILSLDEATGGFTWIANTGGSGSSKWTDGGTFTYLTATGDDLVLGGNAVDTGFFFDVSASTVAFEGATANGFETTLGVVDPTADRALNLPNVSGTLATVDGAQTFTSATWNATAIGVAYGGTGLSATPTNGQLAIGNGTGYTLATLTDGTGITITEGAGTITVASTLGTTIEGSEIADGTIEEVDLEITNAPTGLNGYILSLDEATGGFTWIANTGGSGSSKWTDGGTFTYLTATGDDLVLGSATADSGFFFDVSASTVAFEGATANGFETTLGVVDPTADRALNLPNVSGTLATVDGAQTFTSATWNATAIGVAYGGTGLSATPTNGQLAIGNGTGYTLATLTDGTGITITEGAGTITVASTLGTTIEGSEIADGTIEEVDLEITNAPTGLNGYILSLDEATGGFTWIANTGGSGSSKWTDGGTFTYLTATGDDLVLGSATADSGFFFDVSASTVAFEGATANGFETTLGVVDPTADRALNLPNVSGTLATVDGAQTFTSATWNATAIGVAYGGTGLSATPTNGQLAIGNGTGYTLATLTDGTGITITEGAGTITVASTLGTTIEGSEIADGTIEEVDLEITNAPTGLNGYILSLDEATGGFTWIANTGGSGSSKWTDGGTFTYLTATGDDLVLGSATADSGFFFDVSASTVAFEGATANGFETTLGVVDPTADRALNLPNVSGTLATVDGAQTFTSATWNATAIGVAYGGTGLSATPTNGQLAIGNGTGYTLATLTDGTGITITEGAGTITVASTLGTDINLASAEVTGTLPVANGGTGATTLTQNGVLLGNGTGAVSAVTGTSAPVPRREPDRRPGLRLDVGRRHPLQRGRPHHRLRRGDGSEDRRRHHRGSRSRDHQRPHRTQRIHPLSRRGDRRLHLDRQHRRVGEFQVDRRRHVHISHRHRRRPRPGRQRRRYGFLLRRLSLHRRFRRGHRQRIRDHARRRRPDRRPRPQPAERLRHPRHRRRRADLHLRDLERHRDRRRIRRHRPFRHPRPTDNSRSATGPDTPSRPSPTAPASRSPKEPAPSPSPPRSGPPSRVPRSPTAPSRKSISRSPTPPPDSTDTSSLSTRRPAASPGSPTPAGRGVPSGPTAARSHISPPPETTSSWEALPLIPASSSTSQPPPSLSKGPPPTDSRPRSASSTRPPTAPSTCRTSPAPSPPSTARRPSPPRPGTPPRSASHTAAPAFPLPRPTDNSRSATGPDTPSRPSPTAPASRSPKEPAPSPSPPRSGPPSRVPRSPTAPSRKSISRSPTPPPDSTDTSSLSTRRPAASPGSPTPAGRGVPSGPTAARSHISPPPETTSSWARYAVDTGFFFDVSASTVAFEGATANGFETTLGVVDPTADRALNLPNVSGTLATVDGAQTFTSATWNATAIGVAYGGTGLSATPTNGQLAIGNGTGYTLATLTDGTGITITEGAGTITVASTLGNGPSTSPPPK